MDKKRKNVPEVSLEDQRREQIIAAVVDCVSHEGLEKTTIRNVANRAGISPGLLNYYFKDKKGLVTEAIASATNAVGHLVDMSGFPLGARRLELILKRYLRDGYPGSLPLTFWLQLQAAGSMDPDLGQQVRLWKEDGLTKTRRSIEAAIAEGHFRSGLDVTLLGTLVYAAMTGLAAEIAVSPDLVSPDDAVEAAMLLLGLLATGGDPGTANAGPAARSTTPDIVDAQVISDPRLTPAAAAALSSAFRAMYATFADREV